MSSNKLQWKAWMKQEETQIFFKDLDEMRLEFLEAWASGNFTRESAEGTAVLNAKALGQVQLLDSILDLRTEKVMENGTE